MADRIVTAAKADRTPRWNVWQLVPEAKLWEAVALSLDIEPRKVCFMRDGWMAGPEAGPLFEEGQDFHDRLDVASAIVGKDGALRPTDYAAHPKSCSVRLREFAAWVRQIGWGAPPKLLAMADEQVAIKADRADNGNRTATATAKRGAKKADRLGNLKRFIEDVYKALDKAGHEVGEKGHRKPLPVSADDLHTLFLVRHPEHTVALATFDDDLGKIATLKRGPKRYEIKELAEMLAGKFSV